MTLWIVTVKLPRNKDHDPRNKIIGKCPLQDVTCTDTTGEHHSIIFHSDNYPVEEVIKYFSQQYHVTRVEEVA